MSRTAFMLFFVFLGAAVAVPFVSNPSTHSDVSEDDICDYCVNLTMVKKCGNIAYCIRDVWSHQKLPPDNDDVCQICKDMVKQARDQLESNETQEELREVFEGSCKLIPIKPVTEECIKLSDEFIVELVSMLTSQMNPQIVCATCGLCNSARIDRLLSGVRLHSVQLRKGMSNVRLAPSQLSTTPAPVRSECDRCKSFTNVLDRKFRTTSFEDFRFRLLQACRSLGSFTDSCAAVVFTNAEEWHEQLKKSLDDNKNAACELTNMCPVNHKHVAQVEIINESSVGFRPVSDDQTCQFCEHMITHLRDILVANSTELEFKQVMEGICKQLGKQKDECLSVVDQYYGMIYNFLVNHLNGQEICAMAGLCQQPGQIIEALAPLLPVSVIKNLPIELTTNPPRLDNDELVSPVLSQLPIERLHPFAVSKFYNTETCAFCEYFLHYVQDKLALPATEAEVKRIVEEGCDHLPESVNTQCRGFVESYGDAFIAIFIQQIDPTVICPGMGFCPNSDIVVFGRDPTNVSDKPACPLCLLALQEVTNTLKDNKTEENIRSTLENLCSHLSKSLAQDCKLFVDAYSRQVIDMLLADLSPQQICERLKLCNPALSQPTPTPEIQGGGNILTNEIEDEPRHLKDSSECVICEFVISRLEKMITKNASEDEIEDVFYRICSHMPKTVEKQCNSFIDTYGRAVIELLVASADPKTVCTAIDLCSVAKSASSDRNSIDRLKKETHKKIEECALCQALTIAAQTLMQDPDVEKDFNLLLERACQILPARQYQSCTRFIEVYGPSIENILSGLPIGPGLVCSELGVCVRQSAAIYLENHSTTTESHPRYIIPRVVRLE